MTRRKPTTPPTNIEFVTDLMEHSRSGALAQVFVIEAISRYAKQCAEAAPEAMETGLISGAAWQRTAREIHEKIEERFAR